MARTPPPRPGGRGSPRGAGAPPFGANRAPPFGRGGKPPGRNAAAERKEERAERGRGKRR